MANVYILRNGVDHWNGVALVVAQNEDQAKKLTTWDYSDETVSIKQLEGFTADGPARVEFQIYGD